MRLEMEDVDIRCGDGWQSILQRMLDELNDGGLDMYGLVAGEDGGRLRIDYNSPSDFRAISRILLLAECRSYYTCETCGAPGEHRKLNWGWKTTRCTTHQSMGERAGRLIYDAQRTPWRQMSDGRWRYDPAADALVEVQGSKLFTGYPNLFAAGAVVELSEAAETIFDEFLRRAARMPLPYKIRAARQDAEGRLVVDDNIYELPDTPARDLLMAAWAFADDKVAKL